MSVEIPKQLVETYTHNVFTKRSLNLIPFGKISESGDGGHGGGSFRIKRMDGIVS
ncbi:MAG: hypothetical protein QN423_12435 [Nitrososphaeraceae archaeon]|nr:hypothetical protein [Nitrososphaeraceae archaeon]